MTFTVLIPARLASTRLPNKPLADIGGLPMVVRVARQALLAQAERVVPEQAHADPGQPRGEPRQVGVGPRRVHAFLPVERLVHEQRQVHGEHALDREHGTPCDDEGLSRVGFVPQQVSAPLHCRQWRGRRACYPTRCAADWTKPSPR